MDKTELVNKLISNDATPFVEADRKGLLEFSVETLNGLIKNAEAVPPKEPEPAPAPVAPVVPALQTNAAPVAPVALTAEQYVANAPADIRDMLNEGLLTHNQQRANLVQQILSNKRNIFPAEQLNTRSLTELRAIAALAVEPKPVANYYGGGAQLPVANTAEETPMGLPKMDFSK